MNSVVELKIAENVIGFANEMIENKKINNKNNNVDLRFIFLFLFFLKCPDPPWGHEVELFFVVVVVVFSESPLFLFHLQNTLSMSEMSWPAIKLTDPIPAIDAFTCAAAIDSRTSKRSKADNQVAPIA